MAWSRDASMGGKGSKKEEEGHVIGFLLLHLKPRWLEYMG